MVNLTNFQFPLVKVTKGCYTFTIGGGTYAK